VISVENLSKSFGDLRAVDGISFEVRTGEVYGLLGPNGAGKTTTISMITGLLKPDGGRVLYEGTDIAADPIAVKAQLGVVPQETAVYEDLSARENLSFWAGLYGLAGKDRERAVEEVLERVELTSRAKDRVKDYSGGMKRRLNLALGLVHRPKVVLLDEPTGGIDPQARASILELVRSVAAAGTTVLYTTHYLEEAERLCDRIAIMDHGRILAEGTLDELKAMVGEKEMVAIRGEFDVDDTRRRLESLEGVEVHQAEPGMLALTVSDGGRGVTDLLAAVFGGGLPVDGVSIQPPSLNSLFLKLTGRELRD
jgi:ABC-2 type transport system ATP-binding protein